MKCLAGCFGGGQGSPGQGPKHERAGPSKQLQEQAEQEQARPVPIEVPLGWFQDFWGGSPSAVRAHCGLAVPAGDVYMQGALGVQHERIMAGGELRGGSVGHFAERRPTGSAVGLPALATELGGATRPAMAMPS